MKEYLKYAWASFWNLDPTPTRTFLGLTSLLWVVMLLWNGATLDKQIYYHMGEIANGYVWAAAFFAHSIGMLTAGLNIYNQAKWTQTAFAFLGVVLYFSCSVSMLISIYPPPAVIAAEIVMAIASFWVLCRTNYPEFRRRVNDRPSHRRKDD